MMNPKSEIWNLESGISNAEARGQQGLQCGSPTVREGVTSNAKLGLLNLEFRLLDFERESPHVSKGGSSDLIFTRP